MEQAVKKCGCGKAYTKRQWDGLAYVGLYEAPEDAFGPAECLEMRNCTCGSTIAIDLRDAAPYAVFA